MDYNDALTASMLSRVARALTICERNGDTDYQAAAEAADRIPDPVLRADVLGRLAEIEARVEALVAEAGRQRHDVLRRVVAELWEEVSELHHHDTVRGGVDPERAELPELGEGASRALEDEVNSANLHERLAVSGRSRGVQTEHPRLAGEGPGEHPVELSAQRQRRGGADAGVEAP